MLPTLRSFFKHVAPRMIGEYSLGFGGDSSKYQGAGGRSSRSAGGGKSGGGSARHPSSGKFGHVTPSLVTFGSRPSATDRFNHRGGSGNGFDAQFDDEVPLEPIKDGNSSGDDLGDLEAGHKMEHRLVRAQQSFSLSPTNSIRQLELRNDLKMRGVETTVTSGSPVGVRNLDTELVKSGSGDGSPQYPVVTTRIEVTYDEPNATDHMGTLGRAM